MIAARHILFEKRLPYDTKIEYIESSGAAYFSLRDYLIATVLPWGTTDDWEVRIGVVDPSQSGDKKMFGATYPIVDFIAGRDHVELKSVDGVSLYRNDAGYVGWHVNREFLVGTMAGDHGEIMGPSQICPHRIYSFSRIRDGKLVFDFIPCIMDGVVGMYEDISGVFYSSQTSTPFIAGPEIK